MAVIFYVSLLLLCVFAGFTLHNMVRFHIGPLKAASLTVMQALFRVRLRELASKRRELAEKNTLIAVATSSRLEHYLLLALMPKKATHVLSKSQSSGHFMWLFMRFGRHIIWNEENATANRQIIGLMQSDAPSILYVDADVSPGHDTRKILKAAGWLAWRTRAEIVPIRFSGTAHLWISNVIATKAPRRFWKTIIGQIGEKSSIAENFLFQNDRRQALENGFYDIISTARFGGAETDLSLFDALKNSAKKFGGKNRLALEDAVTGGMNHKMLFIGARVLGKRFAALTEPGEAVAVLLPNANAVAVTFLGLQSAGRIPAMLNYTAGPANIVSACKTAKARIVILSRAFVEKADLEDVVSRLQEEELQLVWLEDERKSVTFIEKISAALLAYKPIKMARPQDAAVILFTSGSEGTPKGVVLSHKNIIANCAQVDARIDFTADDKLFNVLPVFHSFGLTGGMMLPLLYGVQLFLYPSPLHYKLIPQVVRKTKSTIMFGTDTFLTAYARTAKEGDFDSLRFAVAGAEAVKPSTRETYLENFGVALYEGFGMTEAAPVVAVNTPTHNKPGTVGRILPGIDVRLEPVDGIDDGGRMYVRGPNVMLGYFMADKPGVLQPPPEGWHDSGDIVQLDDENFITIKGRVKRFAKIAGEMVSLGAVELLVKNLWPEEDHAAVSVPDKRKGERVVLITTHDEPSREDIVRFGKEMGTTELMVPSDFVKVPEIPVLGSGKTDYMNARKLAMQELGLNEAA